MQVKYQKAQIPKFFFSEFPHNPTCFPHNISEKLRIICNFFRTLSDALLEENIKQENTRKNVMLVSLLLIQNLNAASPPVFIGRLQ